MQLTEYSQCTVTLALHLDETGHIIRNFLVTDPIVIQWKKEEVTIYTQVANGLNDSKKEARQVNQKFFEF